MGVAVLRNHRVGDKIPIAIYKDVGEPVIKPDAAYPPWLKQIASMPTISDLERARARRRAAWQPGSHPTPEGFAMDKRYLRLKMREKIRGDNAKSLVSF